MEPMSYTAVREVSDDDIDMLGHASNIAIIRWIQDAAVAHSGAVGLDLAAYARIGAVFVIRRHEVDYLRSLVRGDRVQVRTQIGSVMAAKCERTTEIIKDGQLAVRALTTWGFIDAATGRPTRIVDEIRSAFGYSPRLRAAQAPTIQT